MKFLPPAQLKIDLELRMTQSTTYSRSQIPLNFMMTTRLRTQVLSKLASRCCSARLICIRPGVMIWLKVYRLLFTKCTLLLLLSTVEASSGRARSPVVIGKFARVLMNVFPNFVLECKSVDCFQY